MSDEPGARGQSRGGAPLARARADLAAGRLAEAEAGFRAVLAAGPDPQAVEGMGDVAFERGDWSAAAEFYDIALNLEPNLPDARVNLAVCLLRLGRMDEALVRLRQAVAAAPDHMPGHYWLGQALLEAGRVEEAVDHLARGVELFPRLVVHMSREINHRLQDCAWADWEKRRELLETAALRGQALCDPVTLMLFSRSQRALAACARRHALHHPPLPPLCTRPHPPGGRIRLAFLSSDFRDHPVSHLLCGVLERFDRRAFHLTAVSHGPAGDSALRRRILAAFDEVVDVRELSDASAAEAIFERNVDIAVTLNGYTGKSRPRILARRPAPVQASFHGYPGSMGAPYIDYLIADRHVIPPGDEAFYTEQVVRMPNSYQPTDDRSPVAETAPSRAEEDLPKTGFVFMAYNRTHKISPGVFDSWMRILRRTPGSVLWLQGRTPAAMDNLRREAAARGIDPGRLRFAGRVTGRDVHLARHRLADLFLDTWPYNAHATASDALWAGLPVLTRRGATFPGRVCAGLLASAGLEALIADSPQAYEDLAVALATDPARLAALRARIAAEVRESPLFDTAAYTRDLERAFRQMHADSQAGRSPRAFDVADLS